jgi:hypothetical protein
MVDEKRKNATELSSLPEETTLQIYLCGSHICFPDEFGNFGWAIYLSGSIEDTRIKKCFH